MSSSVKIILPSLEANAPTIIQFCGCGNTCYFPDGSIKFLKFDYHSNFFWDHNERIGIAIRINIIFFELQTKENIELFQIRSLNYRVDHVTIIRPFEDKNIQYQDLDFQSEIHLSVPIILSENDKKLLFEMISKTKAPPFCSEIF